MISQFVNYCEIHTPVYEEELKPVERASIARYADIPVKIPFIGAVVGLARMISSFAVALITLCAKVGTRGKVNEYFNHVFLSGIDEFTRGVVEFFTFGCSTFFIDHASKKDELTGLVHSFAYGRYVYISAGGVHLYSNTNFTGKTESRNLRIKINCSVYYGSLQFDYKAVNRAK